MNIIKFDKIDSTSTYARQNADSLPLPSLIIADYQSAGRGRRGNSFYSPEGTGLYFTLLFEAPKNLPLITPAAALAVCKALKETFNIDAKIKWVNDVFFNGKKICGILSECYVSNGKKLIAVGIGVNLTTADFPENLPNAGSIGQECNKAALAEKISNYLLDYASDPDDKTIASDYEKQLFIIEKEISFIENNVQYSAIVKGINEQCNLEVKLGDGTIKTLSSGEISIIL